MADWTKLNYPVLDTLVWVVNAYSEVGLGKWDGERWCDYDGDALYSAIVAWKEIDYTAVKEDWNKS